MRTLKPKGCKRTLRAAAPTVFLLYVAKAARNGNKPAHRCNFPIFQTKGLYP